MVIGTTGLQASDHAIIDQAAADIPVLQAPNMSLGVNLLFQDCRGGGEETGRWRTTLKL